MIVIQVNINSAKLRFVNQCFKRRAKSDAVYQMKEFACSILNKTMS